MPMDMLRRRKQVYLSCAGEENYYAHNCKISQVFVQVLLVK